MNVHIGFLPLYIKLYDDSGIVPREPIERFRDQLVSVLDSAGIDVEVAPICRTGDEVAEALSQFEDAGVEAIITVHLAYSPSLESAPQIAGLAVPLLVWNTTPSATFGPTDDPDQLVYNHGIHGVQDFCNVLCRHGKEFRIVSGHWEDELVQAHVVGWCRGVGAASAFSSARVGIVGKPFPGMADFAVPPETLRRLGITIVEYGEEVENPGASTMPDSSAVEKETFDDLERFAVDADPSAHRRSNEIGLTLRDWIEREGLSAVTVDFLDIDAAVNFPAMPFLEVSKAMSRGVGYAGEGDVLTAAFVGALMAVGLRVSFSEMFCPDWAGNRIFLSHMGEANVDCMDDPVRIIDKPFPFTDADDTVSIAGRFAAGEAALIDLAPARGPGGETFCVVVVSGSIVAPKGEDNMSDLVRGWFMPGRSVADTLSDYSDAGGTHHIALVYGNPVPVVEGLCDAMGWDSVKL